MINTYAAHSPRSVVAQLVRLGVTQFAADRAVKTVQKLNKPVRLVGTPGVRNLTVGTVNGIYTAAWF